MLGKQKGKLLIGVLKIKEGILNITASKTKDSLKLYKNFLYKNLSAIKRVEYSSTRYEAELSIEGKSSINAFIWQQRLVSINNIFALMLGIIDARNDDYERSLSFNRNFNDIDRISEIQNNQEKLKEYRKIITNDYCNISPKNIISNLSVIEQTLKTVPSYKNFNNLFDDISKNHYQLSIQGEVIRAYMLGYNNSLSILPEEIMPYYESVISRYEMIRCKNNYYETKVKRLINDI